MKKNLTGAFLLGFLTAGPPCFGATDGTAHQLRETAEATSVFLRDQGLNGANLPVSPLSPGASFEAGAEYSFDISRHKREGATQFISAFNEKERDRFLYLVLDGDEIGLSGWENPLFLELFEADLSFTTAGSAYNGGIFDRGSALISLCRFYTGDLSPFVTGHIKNFGEIDSQDIFIGAQKTGRVALPPLSSAWFAATYQSSRSSPAYRIFMAAQADVLATEGEWEKAGGKPKPLPDDPILPILPPPPRFIVTDTGDILALKGGWEKAGGKPKPLPDDPILPILPPPPRFIEKSLPEQPESLSGYMVWPAAYWPVFAQDGEESGGLSGNCLPIGRRWNGG